MRQKLLLLIFSLKVLLIKCNWRSIMVKMTFEEYQNESYILVFWHCTYSNIILTYIIIHLTTWPAHERCFPWPVEKHIETFSRKVWKYFWYVRIFLISWWISHGCIFCSWRFLSVQTRLGMAWKCLLLFPFKTPKVEAQFNQIIN